MIESAIKRGILVAVIVSISCILGIVAAISIPVQMIPDLEVRTISVRTGWPGATPQDVEKEILIEQERYLRSVTGLQRMISLAEMGQGNIELEFPFGVDVNESLIRVSNALSQVPSYPENVDQPRLFSDSFSSNAFMYFQLIPVDGNPMELDIDMLFNFADEVIRPRMESVPGVSQIEIRGGSERQIQINIDAAKLAQRGISLTQVRDAIRSRNSDSSAGDIEDGNSRFLLRVVGRFEELSELRNAIIQRNGNSNVYLKDVATVKLDHFEKRELSYANGERNLGVSVRRETGSNVIEIKQQILPIVAELNEQLLAANGLKMELFSDDVIYVSSSLKNVWINLLLGAGLATLVMFYFLRSARTTLIGVIGIPLCTIAAFIALLAFGRTINVISMAGVAFAIGMTVDNTIVVLESIVQFRRKGLAKLEAAIEGVKDVWPAVLASTATTILVFAPILFIQQEAGQLYSDVAIAISGAILASMLVAIFVVPVAMGRLNSNASEEKGMQQRVANQCKALVEKVTATVFRARVVAGSFIVIIMTSAYLLMPAAEYLPEGEEPKAFSTMTAPPDFNLSKMEQIGDELRAYFTPFVEADPDAFAKGEAEMPSLLFYNMRVNIGGIWMVSMPTNPEEVGAMMDIITNKFESYEGMRAFSSRGSIISSNDGGTRAVAVEIAGSDIEQLYKAANAVFKKADSYFNNPQLNSDPSSLTLEQPFIEIRPNWQRLAELGMNASDFGYSVAAVSDGAFVDEFLLNDDKVDMFMFSGAGNQQTIQQLASTPILTPAGNVLPLNSLATLLESKSSDSVRRIDGERTVSVYIIPPREVALETAVKTVREQLLPELRREGAIAQGLKVSISGAADQLEATQESLSQNFIIAVALCYLLLVAIFSHWGYPLFVLAMIPLGMAGGLLGLIALNGVNGLFGGGYQPFDMITMLGFLILLGTVVNNPILIVDQTRRNLQKGKELSDAVKSAVETRLRPIMMSTTTTIFGLAPLVLIPGEGTELYRGVGIIVLSGIFVSTILSLTFLPALLVAVLTQRSKKAA
ncbi:efflux RND transporter permease subunit [Brumicola nitratireducens]|uniref:Acriflavin resistance protein n=1 Tax=Glaciecola nitratireducens (strain JCM 12485 / KCTC 12276 / FR1064) TaxID=1085623 RepID=G4QFB0_GLANF|nr:efflux RND transporter permease subunit [Glaciecola nitratireducens]AEP28454.1 acriflavin resistance protein [Glaciecola nitratireducens FR1064]